MDLFCLKKGSPAAGPLDGGSWRWCFRSGARTHQEDRKKGKTPDQPILTSQECSVERKRLQAAQPPRVARRCISSLARTARLNRGITASELKSAWEKNRTCPSEWNWDRSSSLWDKCRGSKQRNPAEGGCLKDESQAHLESQSQTTRVYFKSYLLY